MGGATLIRAMAQFTQIEALFVDSSFASLDYEFDLLVPYPVINPLAKLIAKIKTGININKVNPLDEIGKISPRPVYIVHSNADTVPFLMQAKNYSTRRTNHAIYGWRKIPLTWQSIWITRVDTKKGWLVFLMNGYWASDYSQLD